jgi:hypothetical protein
VREIPFALLVLIGLAVCGVVVLLPRGNGLLPLQLALATWGTLILPGAVIVRLLGWPLSPAAALPACAAWSITALAPGFVLMLLTDGGLGVAVLWLLAVIAVGLVVGRGKPVEMDLRLSPELILFVGGVGVFTVLLWLGSWNNVGDAVEHIARMRKITELDPPRSLDELGLLPPETGLHPGYAFPLWHATGAVTVWISGLEETTLFRFWPTALFPFVAMAIYRAGRVMFGSSAAGVATVIAYLGAFAFPASGVGYLNQLSYPGYISIFLFWPLVVERTFTYLQEGRREALWTIAAASFTVSAIHPSYAPFMILLIGAFLVVRLLLMRERTELRRIGVSFAALTVPFLLFLVWLFPAADSSASTISRAGPHFSSLVNMNGDLVSMKSEWLTRGGPIVIAALLCVPIAAAATRTRAAAFIAGASLTVILILIVPYLFTPFAHVMSISQGRRFIFYFPFAFALTGGALVLARFRWFAVAGALALGTVLHLVGRGDFSYTLKHPGPGWVAWLAAATTLVVLGLGVAGKVNVRYRGDSWALGIVLAFVLPVAVAGIYGMKIDRPEPDMINPSLVAAVNENVTRDEVVLSPPKTAYRLTAQAPVYVVAVAGGHGGDTKVNKSYARRLDAQTFFFDPSPDPVKEQRILERWDVDWVLVRKDLAYPSSFMEQYSPVYEDKLFALYPVDPATIARIDAQQSGSAPN